ncbi:F0F1 ATP synthase subunit epsilon [Aestuariivirga sp. YIM B02566]|jgi:F-type H+-transporting ATPase subunit epsilon|uniref:F0F1 ATP synthase subunit epsilon n=1 Tax=Taklimakanibacter albus TaxID=2800327 RepID=A0ACC5R8R6_9HYPH|nr:F0F1 ATP synthase subunit epsilon [Aestuariivirga sp. YIM B02566]MBK1869051.1 F0F1 ATP synthase subunit epsilon [Aestuariivirga sp. YIM B02566]
MALHFELVSPERLLFSGDVAEVDIPGTEGDMGILPGHAPVLSTLRPGVVTVTKEGGAKERIFVRGGFAEVNPQGLTVLAEVAVPVAELNAERLAQEVKDAQEDVSDAQDDETRRRAQENLDHLQALQSAL